jgi:hypothetical protein
MRLLKVILVIFFIYFIRRFIQMYRVMRKIQQEGQARPQEPKPSMKSEVVEADYRVVD